MLLTSKDSPLNSAFVVENLCGLIKRTINYKIKLKNLGNFYATTWLIFTGPVTNSLAAYVFRSCNQTTHPPPTSIPPLYKTLMIFQEVLQSQQFQLVANFVVLYIAMKLGCNQAYKIGTVECVDRDFYGENIKFII